jgi:MFS transporter, FSR family, fosmidomycin resistance protein
MGRASKIALLGLAHGLSDCAAGFMIGSLPQGADGLLDTGALVLLYNVLAFGGQVPAGMLVDRLGRPKLALVISIGLMAAGLLLFPIAPLAAICLAGLGGAFFHVAGGMLTLLAYPESTVGAGLFAAPGVLGLGLGGYLAWTGVAMLPWLALVALGIMALIIALPYPQRDQAPAQPTQETPIDWHDLIMLVLLLAIGLRSAVWNAFQLIHDQDHALLLILAAAAMIGKIAGGIAAQRWGWRRYGIAAMAIATPLLTLGGTTTWALVPGIFLLQSATPAAVLGMYRLLPRAPATAVGMCFGLAIAAGGIPAMLGWQPPPWTMALLLGLAICGYFWGIKPQLGRSDLGGASESQT